MRWRTVRRRQRDEGEVASSTDRHTAIGGWLWLLSMYLAVWQPLTFAVVASSWVAALPVRGWPLGLLLAAKLGVVGVGVAAARAILANRSGEASLAPVSGVKASGALPLVFAALVSTLACDLLVYTTSIAPNNRMPGDTPWYIAWTLLVNGSWLAYVARWRWVGGEL